MAGVLQLTKDGEYALQDCFFRRSLIGSYILQHGTRQLDWTKIKYALSGIDPEPQTSQRKLQYKDVIRQFRRRHIPVVPHTTEAGMPYLSVLTDPPRADESTRLVEAEQTIIILQSAYKQLLDNQYALLARLETLEGTKRLPHPGV